ncbi:Glutamate synthase (NADPH) small chain [Gammaproteobacteria bacterium]
MAVSHDDLKQALTFRRFKDGDYGHRPWQEEIFKASWTHKCPTYVHRTPPCQGSCPSGEDIRGWLDIVRGVEKPTGGMSWQEYAFRRSTDANPFPSMMGRVCPAPCEDGCNRNALEDHVGINSVEQYIGDWALEHGLKFTAGADSGRRVAIIGGGPAGLAAAYQLRRKGHGVTVFDANEQLGGMFRFGIPGYRVPRDKLDGEIQRIIDMGVEVRLNTRVGREVTLDSLEKEFDAVFWALGAQTGRDLPIPGFEESINCVSGIAFLSTFNVGRLQMVSPRVVVVGGGDTSIDVASVARRLGHIVDSHDKDLPEHVILGYTAHDVSGSLTRAGAVVTLTSLFPVEKMTAAEHEVEDAKREGITILGGVMPLEMIRNAEGRATAMKLCECTMQGMKPIAKPGTEFIIEGDLFVSAIGQKGDMTGVEPLDNGRGFIDCDRHYQVKGRKGHFVAGDIVRPHLLTTAIGQAAIAADSIDQYLRSEELTRRPKVDVRHFNLLAKLNEVGLSPTTFKSESSGVDGGLRGTSSANFAVHNFEDRAANDVIAYEKLFLGHFKYAPRSRRQEIHISADEVIGNFSERLVGLSEVETRAEANRCMSCGMCFECDNCVIFCPQEAVKRVPKGQSTIGRYVYTDYNRCIGCHICADVCPTGYIEMGMGE